MRVSIMRFLKSRIIIVCSLLFALALLAGLASPTFSQQGVVYYANPAAADQGLTGDRTIKGLVDAIGPTKKATIVLAHSSGGASTTYTFSTSVATTSNITLKIENGALASITTGKTLTLGGPIESGLYQVFSCTGTGKVVLGASATDSVYPQWWGLSTSASDATNSTALQMAIDSGIGIIRIGKGQYSYSKGLTITKALRFEGDAGMGEHLGTVSDGVTCLKYTGSGVALTLYGLDVNGVYNIHLSNFMLLGTASATGGILLGTNFNTPVLLSSIKNVIAIGFTKSGAYGIKCLRTQQTVFENVYAVQCYQGFYLGVATGDTGANTTLTFINCHSRSNTTYGWYIKDLIGSSFYQCMAEANGNAGLYLYSNQVISVSFVQWHSESNNAKGGTAPQVITGALSGPSYINFYGGYFGDNIHGLRWDIDYARYINFHNITMGSYTNSIKITANTTNCNFDTWATNVTYIDIIGNHIGGMVINNLTPNFHSQVMAIGGAYSLPFSSGIILITDTTNHHSAMFSLNGKANSTSEMSDPDTKFANTVSQAGMIGVYYGSGMYRISNNTGGIITVIIQSLLTNM